MDPSVATEYLSVPAFAALAAVLALALVGVSRLAGPRSAQKADDEPARESEDRPAPHVAPLSDAQWRSVLLTVLVSALLVLLYPWVASLDSAPLFVLGEGLIVIGLAAVGLLVVQRGGDAE